MPSKSFKEKEPVEDKEPIKAKEVYKSEKSEKAEKEGKDGTDAKHKQEKEKLEKEHKAEKEHKSEKEHKTEKEQGADGKNYLEKAHKDAETQNYLAFNPGIPVTVPGEHGFPNPVLKTHEKPTLRTEAGYHPQYYATAPGTGEPVIVAKPVEEKWRYYEKDYRVESGPVAYPTGNPIVDRLTALEATVAQLLHFIPESLRPDLTQGALRQEPDAAKAEASAAKSEPPKV